MARPSTKGGGRLKGTPNRKERKNLRGRVKDREEDQITTDEKYEKLTKDYASLETAYVGLQEDYEISKKYKKKYKKMHTDIAKDHVKLEEQFEQLGGACNILLKSNNACKKEVAELIGKNIALLQNVTKLTARNDALITLVKKLDPSRRSLQESPSKKNNPGEKSFRKVRDQAQEDRRKANPRDLTSTFEQAGKGSKKRK